MKSNSYDDRIRALFVADTHFHIRRHQAEERRFTLLLALLNRYAGVPHLVLLGDIFDFWFDYPHFVMKGYEPLLAALDTARSAGSCIHFIGGNHDIWAAEYLHRRLGTAAHGGAIDLDLDGQRVHCQHGDGLLDRNLLYKTFRKIVRNPAGIWLGKALHPEALYAFSTWLSANSRHCTRDEIAVIERKANDWLARQRNPEWDHLVIGHVHHACTVTIASRRLTCLGGWLDSLNYGIWRDGMLEHRRWEDPPS
jgi:UDP-2,3-diacylglucosamine hydrolase